MKKLFVCFSLLLLTGSVFAAPAAKAKKTAEPKKVEIIVIESGEYTAGQEDPFLTANLGKFLEMTPAVTKLTPQQAAQREDLEGVVYDFLPLYLVKKNEAVVAKFADPLKQGYLQATDTYILLPHQTRTGVYTTRDVVPNVLELFVMSQCPYGVRAEDLIIQAQKEGKLPTNKEIRIRYIVNHDPQRGFSSLHGSGEWEEDVRQLLIAKYYPEKFWKYLEIRNKDYRSSRWDKAMEDAGINVKKIMKKFDTEGLELLKQEAAHVRDFNVSASPTLLWEGKVVLDFGTAAQIEGFEFFNPRAPQQGARPAVPAGSC